MIIVLQENEENEDEDAPVLTTIRWRGADVSSTVS